MKRFWILWRRTELPKRSGPCCLAIQSRQAEGKPCQRVGTDSLEVYTVVDGHLPSCQRPPIGSRIDDEACLVVVLCWNHQYRCFLATTWASAASAWHPTFQCFLGESGGFLMVFSILQIQLITCRVAANLRLQQPRRPNHCNQVLARAPVKTSHDLQPSGRICTVPWR